MIYTVKIVEDPETGDLLLPLPVDLFSQLGWNEETNLLWTINDDGSIILTEKKNGISETE